MLRSLALICWMYIWMPAALSQEIKNNGVDRPKLVIGLVIDQMRWDYLHRYQYRYGQDGLNRLLKNGFSYDQAFIPYTPAVTAAGHSTLYTGTVPALHGIIGNDWIEKRSGQKMYCTKDTLVQSVGTVNRNGQMSPRNLLATTIGDELRLASNFQSRVFGIALKDRGGILPAGHSANAAYWLDDQTGDWISSTWYMKNLPPWVNEFNRARKADSLMRLGWNLLYPPSTYIQSTADDNLYEKNLPHEKNVSFPHEYASQIGKNYHAFRQSPYGNGFTFDFAKEMVRMEKLGMLGQTDMLCISLSSTDYVGHLYGTHSMEVEDMYIRLDKDIASFLRFLDEVLGRDQYLLFLSADHGVANTPAMLADKHMQSGHVRSSELAKSINAHLEKTMGISKAVRGIIEYQVYLDHRHLDSLKADKKAINQAIIDYLRSRDEVMDAFSFDVNERPFLPAKVLEKFIQGYHYNRSGDIQYFLKANYSDVLSTGAEHGTLYNYDTHIPLIWFGWKVQAGSSNREVYMTDVAPTLAAKLRIQMPSGSIGKVLEEVASDKRGK